jgi:hypothetical protein
MFKNIPKNDISRRNFKSYKRWVQTNQESPSILIYDGDVVFDVETADSSSGYFSKPIYRSIKSKYYSNGGDVIKTFGSMNPLYEFEVVRNLTETASVIHIPQIHYGEKIKPNSVTLTNLVTSESFTDDGWGNLILRSTGSLVGFNYDLLVGTDGCYQFYVEDIPIVSGTQYVLDFSASFDTSSLVSMEFALSFDSQSLQYVSGTNVSGFGSLTTSSFNNDLIIFSIGPGIPQDASQFFTITFDALQNGYLRNVIFAENEWFIPPDNPRYTEINGSAGCVSLNLVADSNGSESTTCDIISASDIQITSGNEYTVNFYADFPITGSDGMEFAILYDTGSLTLNGVANNVVGGVSNPVPGEIRYSYPFQYASQISPLMSASFTAESDGYLRNMIEIPQSYTTEASTSAIIPLVYYDGGSTYNCLTLNLVADSTGSESTGSESTGSESTGSESTGSESTDGQFNIGDYAGNVFYSDGVVVLNGNIEDYRIEYKSTKTIYELEVEISVDEGEFNTTQNPTAVDVSLIGEYDFIVTDPSDLTKTGSVRIKEVLDISKKTEFYSSISSSISGSWDDYTDFRDTDKTGSYLAPYITTIGLYDDDNNMLAVAKLPNPVKNLPDYELTFLIRIDI